jgi:hypothetical protein
VDGKGFCLIGSTMALLLAGCTADRSSNAHSANPKPGPSRQSTATTPQPQDAVHAVQKWIAAYVKGDGKTACRLQTKKYTQEDLKKSVRQGLVKQGASCEDGVVAAGALARAFGYDTARRSVTLLRSRGHTARVRVVFGHGTPQVFTMTFQSNSWLVLGESHTDS